MDLNFTVNFIPVAETGNLTTAIQKTGHGPAALSAQIKHTGATYYGRQDDPDCALAQAPADPDRRRGKPFRGKARQICRTEVKTLLLAYIAELQ